MNHKKIRCLLVINLLTMLTFNMAHPVTPKLINERLFPAYMFGVFFALMAASNYIMSPIWGSLSDQRGRKLYLILGIIGYGLSQLGFGLSTSLGLIFVFRLLGGVFSICYITVALAYLTDLTVPEERLKYMSYHTATVSLGAALGSLLGGYVGQNRFEYTFIVQAVLCGLLTLVVAAVIKAPKKQEEIVVYLEHLKPRTTFIDFKSVIGSMIVVMTLIHITTTAYNSTINYYIESVLDMPSTVNGVVLAVAGIMGLVMNLVVGPYLGKRLHEYTLMKATTLITGITMLGASLVPSIGVAILFLMGFIASSSLIIPIQQTIVSKEAKENYGEVMGIQGSAKALGMVIGSLSSGFLFMLGEKLPFAMAGICALLAFATVSKLKRG